MISRSLTATFKHYWTDDPAIDRAHPAFNLVEYQRTGDPRHLPAKEGQRLTVFECGPLSRRQFQAVMQLRVQERPIDACVLAVSYGLRAVHGFYDVNGVELEVTLQTDAHGDKQVTAATLDVLYDMALLAQLGTRISNESRLRPTSAQE